MLNAPQNQRHARKAEEKDHKQEVGLEDQEKQARHHEDQIAVEPHKLQPAHRETLLGDEFEEIVKRLQNGGPEPPLEASRYPSVDPEKQTSD